MMKFRWSSLIVDDAYWLIGMGALMFYVAQGHKIPDPLFLALLTLFILESRSLNRAQAKQ